MTGAIVVPVDGTPTSLRALAPAAAIGRALGIPVELVTVVSPGIDPTYARAELERLGADLDVPQRPALVFADNDVAAALVHHVRASRPAVLCMATHGRTALGATLLGSTAASVLGAAESPLVVIGPRCETYVAGGEICVAVDTASELTAKAVDAGACWARASGVPLRLVSAIRSADRALLGDDEPRAALADLADKARAVGTEVSWDLVTSGDDVGATVVDAVTGRLPSLLVVATHARHGLRRVLLGSVAQQIVRLAPCPVLAVPAAAPCAPAT